MKKLSNIAYVLGVLPFVSYAQCGLECDPTSSAVIFGGTSYAYDCYRNTQIVSEDPLLASYSMLEPCDFALTHIELEKENLAATHTNRGVIKVALGDYEGAFSDFQIGLTLLPEAAQIYVNRGNAFYGVGDYQMAIQDYSQSLDMGLTDFSGIYLNLGKSYERIGNNNQAQMNYQRALELSPNDIEARSLLNGLNVQ